MGKTPREVEEGKKIAFEVMMMKMVDMNGEEISKEKEKEKWKKMERTLEVIVEHSEETTRTRMKVKREEVKMGVSERREIEMKGVGEHKVIVRKRNVEEEMTEKHIHTIQVIPIFSS